MLENRHKPAYSEFYALNEPSPLHFCPLQGIDALLRQQRRWILMTPLSALAPKTECPPNLILTTFCPHFDE